MSLEGMLAARPEARRRAEDAGRGGKSLSPEKIGGGDEGDEGEHPTPYPADPPEITEDLKHKQALASASQAAIRAAAQKILAEL